MPSVQLYSKGAEALFIYSSKYIDMHEIVYFMNLACMVP